MDYLELLTNSMESLLDKKFKRTEIDDSVRENPNFIPELKKHYLAQKSYLKGEIEKQLSKGVSVDSINYDMRSYINNNFLNDNFINSLDASSGDVSIEKISDAVGVETEEDYDKYLRKILGDKDMDDSISLSEYKRVYPQLMMVMSEIKLNKGPVEEVRRKRQKQDTSLWVKNFLANFVTSVNSAINSDKKVYDYLSLSKESAAMSKNISAISSVTEIKETSKVQDLDITTFRFPIVLSEKKMAFKIPGIGKKEKELTIYLTFTMEDFKGSRGRDSEKESVDKYFSISLDSAKSDQVVLPSRKFEEKSSNTLDLAKVTASKGVMPMIRTLVSQDIFKKL